MMCLFFKFCQILKISNLLPARSLENPVKAQVTPDCQRQFETDTLMILRGRFHGLENAKYLTINNFTF
jgi:hypothetical protein